MCPLVFHHITLSLHTKSKKAKKTRKRTFATPNAASSSRKEEPTTEANAQPWTKLRGPGAAAAAASTLAENTETEAEGTFGADMDVDDTVTVVRAGRK